MPGFVHASAVDPLAVETQEPVGEDAQPDEEERTRSDPPEQVGAECPPDSERESHDQQAGEVRPDLVVDPCARSGQGAEVGDVVVSCAVGARLRQAAHHPPEGRRDESQKTADPSGAERHSATLSQPAASG
jgi:hypothetical protein